MRGEYRFQPGLGVAIEGDAATLRHFDREYGSTIEVTPTPIAVEVMLAGPGVGPSGSSKAGGHKSMRWRIELTTPDAMVLGARIELAGWPRSFARSLVQGYFIEPLLSVAAVRANAVLLPAAAFLDDAGAIVVLGRSGSGKTSLSMHALAIGATVLGDDVVMIDADGACRRFPRRLRVYSDLGQRVPLAFRRLPRHIMAQLRARQLLRILTHGAIAPPVTVPLSVFGQTSPIHPAPIRRVVILVRPSSAGELRTEPATVADAVSEALRLIREQREHLALAGGDAWHDALASVEGREERHLAGAFTGASVERIVLPFPLSGNGMALVGAAVGLVPQVGR